MYPYCIKTLFVVVARVGSLRRGSKPFVFPDVFLLRFIPKGDISLRPIIVLYEFNARFIKKITNTNLNVKRWF